MFHVKRRSAHRVAVPHLDRGHGSARGVISPESHSREGSIPQPRRLAAPAGNRHYGFTTCNGALAEIGRCAQSPLRMSPDPLPGWRTVLNTHTDTDTDTDADAEPQTDPETAADAHADPSPRSSANTEPKGG